MRLSFEGCVLDLDTREVFKDGRLAPLSPKAFALIELLALRRPKALSKAEIHQVLWPDTFVTETNLANLVVELRAALGDDPHASRIVRTVPRFGYAFCAEAQTDDRPPSPDPHGSLVEHRLVWGRREVALEPGENLLGREHNAAAWINDESVSRRHARIRVADDRATIEDLSSKNGTFVRGKRVQKPTLLEDGDEIVIGEVPMKYRTFATEASTRTGRRLARKSEDS